MRKPHITPGIIKRIKKMLAPCEDTNIASRNYAAGKYFIWKNQPAQAKTAITAGDTLVIDTNVILIEDGFVNSQRFATGSSVVQNLGTNYGGDITILEDGYYFVNAYNGESKRWMKVSMDVKNGGMLSWNFTEAGQWANLCTAPVPLKAGTVITVGCYATSSGTLNKLNFS